MTQLHAILGVKFSSAALALLLFVAWGCATNPVTGKKQITMITEAEELAIGQQQDAEIRRQMGEYDDGDLQRYVSEIGRRLAEKSHRPNLQWTFTVIDSPAINAFALPGGYVYITRGILPYLGDESELAGVLGHEIGHITARHAAQQYTRQAQGDIGLAILSIFVPGTRPFTSWARPDWACCSSSMAGTTSSRPMAGCGIRIQHRVRSSGCHDFSPRSPAFTRRASAGSRTGCRHTPTRARESPSPGRLRRSSCHPRQRHGIVTNSSSTSRASSSATAPRTASSATSVPAPDASAGGRVPRGMGGVEQSRAGGRARAGHLPLHAVAADRPRGRTLAETATAEMRSAGYKVEDGQVTQLNGLDAYVGRYRGSVKDLGKA